MAVNDRIAAYRACVSQIAPDDIEIRVGGVGKQHHGERQLRQKALSPMLIRSKPNPSGPEDKAENREHDRAADQGPLDPAGDRYRSEEKPRRKRHFGTFGPDLPRKVRMD